MIKDSIFLDSRAGRKRRSAQEFAPDVLLETGTDAALRDEEGTPDEHAVGGEQADELGVGRTGDAVFHAPLAVEPAAGVEKLRQGERAPPRPLSQLAGRGRLGHNVAPTGGITFGFEPAQRLGARGALRIVENDGPHFWALYP